MSLNAFADGYNKGYRAGYEDAEENRAYLEARVHALEAEVSEARAEAAKRAAELFDLRLEAHAFTVSDAGGPRLFAARDGADATWTVYRVTISTADDGSIVQDIAIARDSVTADRLPAVLFAFVNPAPQE